MQGLNAFKIQGSKEVRAKGYVVAMPQTGHKSYWWDFKEWKERQKSFTQEFWEDYKIHHKGTNSPTALMVKKHFQAASKYDRAALNTPTQGESLPCINSLNSVNSVMRIPSQAI